MVENKKIDCDKMNLINGELKESKNDLENLKDFIKRWEEKIKEINGLKLSNKQAYTLSMCFLEEAEMKILYRQAYPNKTHILEQAGNNLYLALFQANNNYRKEFPSFWDRFHQLKLPDLNLIKKG